MERKDNYAIQAGMAKQRFLGYDQQTLIRKFRLEYDEEYLYIKLLCKPYRINRTTGDVAYREDGVWQDGNSHGEVLTLLDLLCDSREDRYLTGKWKNMQAFGMMFHQNLLEEGRDQTAEWIDREPEAFHRACARLGAERIPGGDFGYAVELFDGLKIGMLFWHGDEEFAPRLRFLWDENAKMYIRYETMFYAVGLLKKELKR